MAPCCECNGINACCKSCSCVKQKWQCTNCFPGRHGCCSDCSFHHTISSQSSQLLPATNHQLSVGSSQPSQQFPVLCGQLLAGLDNPNSQSSSLHPEQMPVSRKRYHSWLLVTRNHRCHYHSQSSSFRYACPASH